MPNPRFLDRLRQRKAPFLEMLGGSIDGADPERGLCTLGFNVSHQFCHSGDVVQGGFVTAMLDAAMSHALFAQDDTIVVVASLEISTRYLEVTRAGAMQATGRIVRLSHRTAFTDSELRDPEGRLLATAQMVAKLGRKSGDGQAG